MENLEDLEMTNTLGQEVRIYDRDGHRIPRREALFDQDQPPCGLLVKLDTISSLFDDGLDDSEALQMRAYPMAFLHNVGHFQSNKIITAFDDAFTCINLNCYAAISNASPNDFPPADTDAEVDRPVVTGLSSQVYNEVTHRATHRAGGHDVQKGHVTAALAGAWA